MIVKIVVPDSIYANVYFARGEQGVQGPTGPTGAQGPSGVVNVNSPITNSGTSSSANIGINQALLQITPAQVTGTAVVTADARLSDQRVPTNGSVTDAKIVAGGLSTSAITGTAVITSDARLSDSRTPTAHAATHASAGSDPVTIAISQVTSLSGTISGLNSAIAVKANSASPTFTGTVTTPVISGTLLWTNSSGVLDKVGDAPGLGYLPYTGSVTGGIAWQNLATLVKTDAANTFTVGGHVVANSVAGTIPWTIKGASGQTANLQEWQNSSGTPLVRIQSSGVVKVGTPITGVVAINNEVADAIVLAVRGISSQTANLQQWQNSAGTVLGFVDSSGRGVFPTVLAGAFTTPQGAHIALQSTATTNIGILVRGAASQTANLQEWQNSAGTVLAKVDSAGIVFGAQIRTASSLALLTEASSGGAITLARPTAAFSNPGANTGRLYFRDGTNAGTLKLVVRAGAAGAETTILDNIPQ